MEVLVTGAGGFSGSHLVPALIARGHHVTAVVGRTRGRLDATLGLPALNVIAGNLSEPLTLPGHIDAIVHAAARSPGTGVTSADMVRDNVVGTQRLVEYAREAGARTFVYLSSLSVYGTITAPVVDEATPIVNPDAYGMTKYLGEIMLRETPASLRTLSIRLPGVLGPRSVRNWLTSVLLAAKAGREIVYYNPDAPFNNAIHINDLCGFVGDLLAASNWDGHAAVTVGAGGMTSVRKAVQVIVEAFGSRSALGVRQEVRPSFTVSSENARRYGYRPMEIEAMLAQFAEENRS